MARLHSIAGLSAALLWASTTLVFADPALQTTGSARTTLPVTGRKPALCQTTLSDMQAADPGWQLLQGRSAALYTTKVIFFGAPKYDTIAYLQKGDTVLLLVSAGGCIIGHSAIPLNTHEKGMRTAVGVEA